MADNIDKSLDQYTTMDELRAYAQAQQKVLSQLKSKIQKLEQENRSLIDKKPGTVPANNSSINNISDEETIAREQLFLLKNISRERELSFEETKKVEIYTKVLSTIKNTPKTIEVKAKQLTDAELLAAIEKESGKNNE